MRKKNNIPQHEFIGIDLEVIRSPCKYYIGIRGTIIDETRRMLMIDTGEARVRVPKAHNTFLFHIEGEEVVVPGNMIDVASEDRTKRLGKNKIRRKFGRIQKRYNRRKNRHVKAPEP